MLVEPNERRAKENSLLRAVIATVVDGIVAIDREGRIKLFNPAAERLFGYVAAEVIEQNIRVLMPEPYQTQHDGYIKNYRATGTKRVIGIGREVKGRRKDGSIFPIELAVGEIAEPETWAFVGIIRDITARIEAFDALTEARFRAEAANRAKSEFLSRMSHELRTPMNAILGFAQLLEMSDEKAMAHAQYSDYLNSIISPAQHLTSLIDDILDFSRVEGGELKVARESVNLADAVAAAVTMAQPMAERLGISIFNRCVDGAQAPVVTGDPVRLRQCIVNLLTNAIKYNQPHGRILIDLTKGPGENVTRLTVEDTGIGIPRERLSELFEPFTRLHPGLDHIEGAGIGLAFTRQLMGAMGGAVSVESDAGRGSRFHLDIQRANGSAEPSKAAQPYTLANWHPPMTDDGKSVIVLYVEDNPANVQLMTSLFRSIPGVELRTAYSAELGLEMVNSIPVRAIILDINLPGISGFDAVEQLRSHCETAQVPVIGLSARATTLDIQRASELGFFRYLTKPVKVPELIDTLRSALLQPAARNPPPA